MRSPRAVVTALLVIGLLAAGCSGDDEPSSTPSSSQTSLQDPDDAPTLSINPVVKLGKVVGRLTRSDRKRLEGVVSDVAVHWLEAAYLGGDYPRKDFRDSWPGFTASAKKLARHDKALMSNARIGSRVDQVNPSSLAVTVDLLGVKKRPVGATAHVQLRFDTEGTGSNPAKHKVYIGGRLRLTPTPHGWKVFAYTINRGDV